MLDVLVTLIGEALKKIFDSSVDKVASKVSAKRSLAIALLELYDAMVGLEESSRAALELFQSYQNGTAAPLRIRARSAMNALVTSVEKFDTKLKHVYSRLDLYNPNLATVLESHFLGKSETLKVINALLVATPRIKLAGEYPTDNIIIPTAMPNRALFGTTYARSDSKRQIAELKVQIDRSLRKQDVNFSEREGLALILHNGELNLKRIEAARRDLAEFIKQNVPLSEILVS
jgi:hypothetical protein